jgi:CDP-glucose 4,6-dehydratase
MGAPNAAACCEPWNFGPLPEDARTVRAVVAALTHSWGGGAWEDAQQPTGPHEAGLLRLSTEKAQLRLGWKPRWHFEETFAKTAAWYREYYRGASAERMVSLCREQISNYMDA